MPGRRDGFAQDGGSGFDYSLESPASGGGANERAVNAALWDIIDGSQSNDAEPDDDPLQLPSQNIWAIIESLRSDPPEAITIDLFWERWFAMGFGAVADMVETFSQHRIDFYPDSFEPNHDFTLAAELTVDGEPAEATFYAGQGDPSWIF